MSLMEDARLHMRLLYSSQSLQSDLYPSLQGNIQKYPPLGQSVYIFVRLGVDPDAKIEDLCNKTYRGISQSV